MRADHEHVTGVLADLVRTESINPALCPSGSGEAEIAERVASYMAELGLDVARFESVPGRPSLVGRWPGESDGPSLMLNAHYDTVGVDGMESPLVPEIRDGRLYGRGAYDMKGALAACLAAVGALRDAGARLAGDLLVSAVADEEHASLGTRELLESVVPDAAIVTEPTGLEVCIAHKGFAWIEVATRGRAAHGSRPDLGVDANLAMGRVLGALGDLAAELSGRPPHPLLGTGSLHVGTLRGGTAPSIYAASCEACVERRTVPGEDAWKCLREIEAALDALSADDPALAASVRLVLHRPPFGTTPDAPIVRTLVDVLEARGSSPSPRGDSVWMDAALFAAAGVDTVVIGPAGEGAHADVEWVDLASVVELAEILAETAAAWCGRADGAAARSPGGADR